MKRPLRTKFAVIYQWRIKSGMENQFHNAWQELTQLLIQKRGARGSRPAPRHRCAALPGRRASWPLLVTPAVQGCC